MLSHFFRKWSPFGRIAAVPVLREHRTDGTLWHILPDADSYFEVPQLAEWVKSGQAVVVKQNLQRTVYRVSLPAGSIYVKVCRANTPRAWVREVLRPPKAQLEFENALQVLSLGIGCTTPLAWGERDSLWPGDSVIVTRAQENALPLDTVLLEQVPTGSNHLRRSLAVALGRFFAKLHDAGIRHPDPHPGNLLVEVPAEREPRLFLLDVHSVRFGSPLSWDESRENLVLLNRWFQLRATRSDRARFWKAYSAARTTSLTAASLAPRAREIETATLESNLRFWSVRIGRYLGNNRQFHKVKRGPLRGHAVRDLSPTALAKLLADPDALFSSAGITLLKDSLSSTVALLPALGDMATPVILKRFRLKKRFAALRNWLRRSPALRSWVNGHALLDRGLPTARPLMVLHRYRNRLPAEGYVLFELVEGALPLPEAVAQGNRSRLAPRLGKLLRQMHELQVSHKDLKAPNLLIDPSGEPVLIDLVGVTTGRAVPEEQRIRELTRLAASFAESREVSRADRLRFLSAYLGEDWKAWKAWWTRIALGVRAKVQRNANLGRPLG